MNVLDAISIRMGAICGEVKDGMESPAATGSGET
jgi:hypothetical protein